MKGVEKGLPSPSLTRDVPTSSYIGSASESGSIQRIFTSMTL
jgi:hypothetical protein